MAQVIHNSKEDLHMNNYVASHGSSWKGIHHSSVFLSHSVSIFLTRFLTKRMSKKLSTKFTQRSDVIPYLNKIFFRINILTLLSKTWWISIHLFSGLQFHFLLSGARKSKGKLDKVAWDKFYALGKKF